MQGSASNGLSSFALESPLFLRNISYIKFAVQEVFGGEQVYINRLYLFDEGEIREPKHLKKKSWFQIPYHHLFLQFQMSMMHFLIKVNFR